MLSLGKDFVGSSESEGEKDEAEMINANIKSMFIFLSALSF